jgi:hemerythrin-like domain-containing protein
MAVNPNLDPMRDEHRRLLARMDALVARLAEERDPGMPVPVDLLNEAEAIGLELDGHLEREDGEVYRSLVELLPETAPRFAALRREREELRGMLHAFLARLAGPGDDDRDEQIAVESEDLAELTRIHVRKEEALVFGLADHALRAVPPPNVKGPQP